MDLSPTHLVISNITNVTSAMRKNSRWARASSYSGSGRSFGRSDLRTKRPVIGEDRGETGFEGEEELMAGFVELRRTVLENPKDLPPLPALVAPFLALIRSPLTTGPITSHALTSLLSILSLFPTSGPSLPDDLPFALSDVSHAVTHCKFEASDSQGDEVVMLKILSVIGLLVDKWGGSRDFIALGDKEVCEMLETGLGLCCQMRLSELLRRTAEATVQSMVKTVFTYLKTIPVSAAGPASLSESIKRPQAAAVQENGSSDAPVTDGPPIIDPVGLTPVDQLTTQEVAAEPLPIEPASTGPFVPYGSATPTELIRVLITLLNPADIQHTDSMRLAALSILGAALETAGSTVGSWPEMRSMLSDEGCKYLFQLTRGDSSNLFASSLRVTGILFGTMRVHLKPQLELFVSYLIDRLAPPPSALHPSQLTGSSQPGAAGGSSASSVAGDVPSTGSKPSGTGFGMTVSEETRGLLLEALAQLSRQGESFLVDLWINYDCDMDREDLFERTVAFLTRGVYPTTPGLGPDTQTDSQTICLQILLSAVQSMAARIESQGETWPATFPSFEFLAETKERKRILLVGASRFNTKPKTGLTYLEEHGLLITEPGLSRNQAIASLLKSSPRLDKKVLGEYISRPENIEVLKAFIEMFDFKGKLVAEAMRDLLEAFRLPGESQQINRITETFAEIYFASGPAEIKSQDAVYVLAYSIIMLNTDLFSPQVRKRMAFDDYKRNLRGVNDGVDFSDSFLSEVYDSIKKREIVMPEEHTGQLGFDYAWKELLSRAPKAGPLLSCNTARFDRTMFQLVSKQIVSAIAYAFTTFNDDYIIQKAITGFRECATIAGAFHLPDMFDHVVMALSQTTGLLDERELSQSSINNPVIDVEGQSLTVSALSVRFGTNFKAQLAAVVLFTIANGNGDSIREGWSQIFEMYQTLFLHSLLPAPMLLMEDFLGGQSMIPLQVSPPVEARERRSDVGLLSTLSSYLLSPYGSSNDNLGVPTCTEDEIEATLSTIDCLGSCRFEELYSQLTHLEVESLLCALRAIKDLADRRLTPRVYHLRASSHARMNSTRDGSTSGRNSPAQTQKEVPLPYDPASVFLLEMLVSLTSQARAHVAEVWPIAFEHISVLLSSASQYSILLIERAVVGLLRLCVVISIEPSLRDQLYVSLDLLRSLPGPILNSVSEQLMAGVAKILEQDASLIKSQTEWGLILALVRGSISHPEASKTSIGLIDKIIAGELGPGLTSDNFAGIVGILSEFANYSGVVSIKSQRGRRGLQNDVHEPAIERALHAVDTLFELKKPIMNLIENSKSSFEEAVTQFYLPPLKALSHLVPHPSRPLRTRALTYLQRALPGSPAVPHDLPSIHLAFQSILFPTLDELLKPQVFLQDPQGMEESRLKLMGLICRVFLVFLSEVDDADKVKELEGAEGRDKSLKELWLEVLECLDRLMNSEKPDQVYEAVPESFKNLLLVLHSSNRLLQPTYPDTRTAVQKDFWATTVERTERFLPTFIDGLFVPEQLPVETSNLREDVDEKAPAVEAGAGAEDEKKEEEKR
ncbi:Pattern-formation protein/guanine nucleotide exchange factor [Phaffia rhodozyma]|uniref:Pattern-formation protein/guanine nucleotide exchange factor n=1 Tax=Phaffia rhodozyma TaxID=264483 RepID=A0A0F7SK31_PHARH|nr:Pattern-formation protein/guanine nucleotide exchange factor [Phaffia rhodozyma]